MKRILSILTMVLLLGSGMGCSSDDNTKSTTDLAQLVITASPKETLEINETFIFTVMLEGEDVTAAVEIYVESVRIEDSKFSSSTAGVFSVIAKGKNVKDSEVIKIAFVDKPLPVKTIVLSSDAGEDPQYGQWVTFKVTDELGTDVTDSSEIKADGKAISGNKYQLKKGSTDFEATSTFETVTATSNVLSLGFQTNYIEIDGRKYETTELRFSYTVTMQTATGKIDLWKIEAFKMNQSGTNTEVYMNTHIPFYRTNLNKMAYPNNLTATEGVTPHIAINNRPIDLYNSTGVYTIADFKLRIDEDDEEYSDENTTVTYSFVLANGVKVNGLHIGRAPISTVAPPITIKGEVESYLARVYADSRNVN